MEPRPLFGLETEYALAAWTGRQVRLKPERAASLLFTEMCLNPHVSGNQGGEGVFLGNGARFYTDAGAHPEYATPEVTTPREAVAHVVAGDRLVRRAAAGLLERHPDVRRCLLTKCNVDFSGTQSTWGQHESYACRRPTPEVADGLVPHMITRILFTGAGGYDNRSPGLHFVLSPRAMHLEVLVAQGSTEGRGVIHLRDESHATPPWHRLHLTYGEANSSQLATFLKVGTTALVVLALDRNPALLRHLALGRPLAEAIAVARDTRCRSALRLEDGRRWRATEIQFEILERIEREMESFPAPPWAGEVCRVWRRTLESLEKDPMGLAGVLDWPTKLALYRDHQRRAGLDEARSRLCSAVVEQVERNKPSPEVSEEAVQLRDPSGWWATGAPVAIVVEAGARVGVELEELERFDGIRSQLLELDTRYAALGGEGIFEALDAVGVLHHRVVTEEEITLATTTPPSDTRAKRRGDAVAELAASRDARCDWTRVVDPSGARILDLSDPWRMDIDWRRPAPAMDQDAEEARGV